MLIADADPRTRMQLALALRRQQLRVIECSLARDVPTLLARERPAVAIVDERLPGPARRIMSELRDDAATRLITIGAGERGDAARFARPLDIEGIVEEVAALLGRPKVTSDLGGALDRLRAAYGQALPAKLDALERLCQEAQGDDAALTKARDAAHKLRGTAGSIGTLAKATICPIDELESAYYLNLQVDDRPGVLAAVAGVFGEHNVSIRSMEQDEIGQGARIVFITHRARERDVQATLHDLRDLDAVRQVGSVLRVIESN